MHAFYWDEVEICKNDALRGCLFTVTSSEIYVIDLLIINLSFLYGATHSAYVIYRPLSDSVTYYLSLASIPLTCRQSLSHTTGKWITEPGREGIGQSKCTEINLVWSTRLHVAHSLRGFNTYDFQWRQKKSFYWRALVLPFTLTHLLVDVTHSFPQRSFPVFFCFFPPCSWPFLSWWFIPSPG